jgi:hypothetical protein
MSFMSSTRCKASVGAGLELGYQVKVEVPGPRRFTTKTQVVPVLADWRA